VALASAIAYPVGRAAPAPDLARARRCGTRWLGVCERGQLAVRRPPGQRRGSGGVHQRRERRGQHRVLGGPRRRRAAAGSGSAAAALTPPTREKVAD
jgi:hypothetical protein